MASEGSRVPGERKGGRMEEERRRGGRGKRKSRLGEREGQRKREEAGGTGIAREVGEKRVSCAHC